MKIGFTGTRQGLAWDQRESLVGVVRGMGEIAEAHHGCAIGADAEFAIICRAVAGNVHRLFGHPSSMASQTDVEAVEVCDLVLSPLSPLFRNHVIVDSVDVLIACPAGMSEEQRSGTWATVRFARKKGRPIVIIWPDGTTTRENDR